MTALPLWNRTPPIAGSNASASGAECQCDGSACSDVPGAPLGFGSSRSSVEERSEAGSVEFTLIKDARLFGGRDSKGEDTMSAKVVARVGGRCRSGEAPALPLRAEV